jgi:hypothetical protein
VGWGSAVARAAVGRAAALRQPEQADQILRGSTLWASRVAAATTGVLLGVAFGLLLADREFLAALTAILVGLAVAGAVRVVVPATVRRPFSIAIAFAFAVHLAVLVVLHAGLVALGRSGFVTGDDEAYARVAWIIARSMRGEATESVEESDRVLLGTFAYAEGALFYVIGLQVLVATILNVGFALALAIAVFDMARRIFDDVAGMIAGVLVALYPSLVVWSSLNLKDALAVLIVGLVLWALVRFQLRPRALLVAAALLLLLPIWDLRLTIYSGLALAIPLSLVTSPRVIRIKAVRIVMTGLVVLAIAGVAYLAFDRGVAAATLEKVEYQREWMAAGFRTGFGDTPAITVKEGDTLLVREAGDFPWLAQLDAASLEEGSAARVVRVGPHARVASPSWDAPMAWRPTEVVSVNPGDLIVVGGPSVAPAPREQWRALDLPAGRQVRLTDGRDTAEEVYGRTLAHLPNGLTHALFAPVPWVITRGHDLLTAPEMLLWYVLMVAAAVTLVRARDRRWLFVPPVVFVLSFLVSMALTEGNVGTVFRHRAMVIPFVIVLAAPSLLWLGRLAVGTVRRGS